MTAMSPRTADRLRAAFGAELDAAVAHDQIERIIGELRDAPSVAPRSTVPRPVPLVVRVAGIAAVAVAVLVSASGVVSQAAVPGDPMYPVKRLLEPVLVVFDGDLAASRRVQEYAVIADESVDSDRVDEARRAAEEAVAALAPDHPLRAELNALIHRTASSDRTDSSGDDLPTRDSTPPSDPESQQRRQGDADDQVGDSSRQAPTDEVGGDSRGPDDDGSSAGRGGGDEGGADPSPRSSDGDEGDRRAREEAPPDDGDAASERSSPTTSEPQPSRDG